MRFYTTEKLSPSQEYTPEGFLICRNVPVARVGEQIYGAKEIPGFTPGPDGLIVISREAKEVFRPETLDSVNLKSLVDDHPESDVNPDNWRRLTEGILVDARRGKGEDEGLLLVDLIVTTAEGIALVNGGKVELSMGYDAEYEEDGPGRGRQVGIICNHVALVDEGRCGSECAIRDSKYVPGGSTVAKTNKRKSFKDTLKQIWKDATETELEKAADAAEVKDEAEEEGGGETHIHLGGRTKWDDAACDALEARVAAMEAGNKATADAAAKDAEEAEKKKAEDKRLADAAEEEEKDKVKDMDEEEDQPEGTGDKVHDSVYFADSFQRTLSLAEILAPGIQLPTFDAKAPKKKTYDSICDLRRKALQVASIRDAGVLLELNSGKIVTHDAVGSMRCSDVKKMFNAAGAIVKAKNAAAIHTVTVHDSSATVYTAPVDRNKVNADFWANRK